MMLCFLQLQCHNYSVGVASGSLCSPLCTGRISYSECLGHGVTPHILKANWQGKDIILKVKTVMEKQPELNPAHKPLELNPAHSSRFNREYFDNSAKFQFTKFIFDNKTEVSKKVLDYVYSECANQDGILPYQKMWYCQSLLGREYLFSVLLKDANIFPEVYGACGNVFAVENVPDEQIEGSLMDSRSWSTRARIGLGMLDMIERLDNTPYGTLYLCDIRFANFGAVKVGSDYVVKPIDLDYSWLPAQMKRVFVGVSIKTCHTDEHCHFQACLGRCNYKTGYCESDTYSNNLIVSCAAITKEPVNMRTHT